MRIKDFNYGPADFIPVAEKTGLIDYLGEIAIHESVKFLSLLQKRKFPDIRVSVNFSPRQLETTSYDNAVAKYLKLYDIKPEKLIAEITESLFVNEDELTKKNILSIKANKITLALDDFGNGYSSIHCLSNIDFDIVKFDKDLIEYLSNDKKGLKNLSDFVHGYGCKIIAEGVETAEQIELLKEVNCDYIQGYYYSKPLISKDAIEYLKKNS